MLTILQNKGFQVIQRGTPEASSINAEDYDLIWIQHETIPESVLSQETLLSEKPIVIFSHMSPFSELHIEFPYIHSLEEKYANLIVCNSPSTADAQRPFFTADDNKIEIYPNPSPSQFSQYSSTRTNKVLKSILVVSNHRPQELDEVLDILRNSNIAVDTLQDISGQKQGTITSTSLLSKYDLIISIGKTVQYCLTMGKPVYIYDQFGGPGYLNDSIFKQIAYHNFSGRQEQVNSSLIQSIHTCSIRHLSAQQIAQQIRDGYEDALQYHKSHRQQFIERYSIEHVFPRIGCARCLAQMWSARRRARSQCVDCMVSPSRDMSR